MPDDERAGIVAEDLEHRDFHPRASGQRVLEHRRLGNRQPDVEAHQHQHGARQKRDAPAERKELIVGQPLREREEHAPREEEPDRRAKLREHAIPGTPARRRVLDREEHRATPLAAEPETLAETADGKKERRSDANRPVGRQRAYRDGRNPHRQERRDERRLAADAVAEVAEERRADGTGHERDRERGERGERGRGGIGRGKEQLRKDDDRGGRVDVEVEELDRGADEAGEEYLTRCVDGLGRVLDAALTAAHHASDRCEA